MKKPCIACGAPTTGSRCSGCALPDRPSHRTDTTKTAWKNLSRRARRAQPFCLLCGSPDRLQADHHPRAWARLAAGLPLRLCDVSVLCQGCNLDAGSSKPGSARFEKWQRTDGALRARTPDGTLETRGVEVGQHLPLFAASRPERYTPGGTNG